MPSPTASSQRRVLLAYFSRTGENYYNGGRRTLQVGNTEVVAGMIGDVIGCAVYRINAADPYSDSYDATVARNVREQDADARPEISGPLPSLEQYDTILLGSPIWNVRPPMIMSTFTERYDFTGKPSSRWSPTPSAAWDKHRRSTQPPAAAPPSAKASPSAAKKLLTAVTPYGPGCDASAWSRHDRPCGHC